MAPPSAFTRTHVWSVAHAEAPDVVTSDWIDEQLADTFERCGVRPGLLESVAGIQARRWWPEGVSFDEAAAMAGRAALDGAGVAAHEIDLLISTSVCKHHLEPSVACAVHHALDLPPTCDNFDLGNACLGFVNAMTIAATAIDAGRIRTALIVDGEGSRQTQLATIARLQRDTTTVTDVFDEFASLTLGSGAAAMVLGGPRDGAHRFLGGITRSATQYHEVCVGDLEQMRTDTAALLAGGIELAREAWAAALDAGWDWKDADHYIAHQVSSVHTAKLCEMLGIDMARVPLTFPQFGNIGPAAVPYTLSTIQDSIQPGAKVVLLGVGSGLNASGAELTW